MSRPRQLHTKAASCLSSASGSSSSGSGQLTSHRLCQPGVSSEDRPLVDSCGFRKTKDSCDSHAAVKCEAVGLLSLNIVEENDRKNSRSSCQFGPGSSDTAPPNNTRLFITEESDRLRKAVDNRQIATESRQIAAENRQIAAESLQIAAESRQILAENRRTAEHFRPKATEKKDTVQLHFRRGAALKYLFT